VTDTFITQTITALSAKSEQRIEDQLEAQHKGVHFWICGVIYRVSGPTEFAMLDPENMCGYRDIHCAICGTETDDDPLCPGYCG